MTFTNDQVVASVSAFDGWIDESNTILDGVSKDDLSDRVKVALSILHLCQEHCGSIRLLIVQGEGRTTASALALLRSAFEALLRGWWVGQFMSDDDFTSRWADGKGFPGSNKKEQLEAILGSCDQKTAETLNLHAAATQNIYNDLIHGGRIQAIRRFSKLGEISYTERPDEVIFCCKTALAYDALSKDKMVQFLGAASAKDKLRELQEKYSVS